MENGFRAANSSLKKYGDPEPDMGRMIGAVPTCSNHIRTHTPALGKTSRRPTQPDRQRNPVC